MLRLLSFKRNNERVQKLFTADLLRVDKSTMAAGLRNQVPFLDTDFLDVVMTIKPESNLRHIRTKKFVLRKAFEVENAYLPILWRQKEQFSDGVGYEWIS
jgi:asparagine synthase (glutamine-hydrolysing)